MLQFAVRLCVPRAATRLSCLSVARAMHAAPAADGAGSYEPVVGITQFANSAPGFTGILKQRYSDFIVREVGLDGKVCVLDDLSTELEDRVFGAKLTLDKDEALHRCEQQLRLLLDEETVARVMEFLRGPLEPDTQLLLPSPEDKELRTNIHKCFKTFVADMVSTETCSDASGKYIRVKPGKSTDKRVQWPPGCPEFLKFALYKENIDTPAAVNALARNVRCNQDNVGFAGTKDKRAVTTQWMTLWRRKPRDVARAINKQTNPTIRVGNFSYVDKPLKLGMLLGNRFGIVLRDIQVDDETVAAACEALSRSGFINYFGLQRFGRIGSRTHDLGREILRANWDGLVASLLSVKEYDKPQMAEAKSYWVEHRDARRALAALPRDGYIEKTLLQHLARFPNDTHGAFNKIAKQTRLLYLHAFQSYIFNQAASYRVATFGLNVVPGDLVMVADGSDGEDQGEKVDEAAEAAEASEDMDRVPPGCRVVVATEDDVAAGKYTMADVVLPLLGYKIQLPANSVREYMLDLLAQQGLDYDVFVNKKQPQYSLSGAYRRVIEMPQDFQWSIREYSTGHEHLLPTDLDLLRERQAAQQGAMKPSGDDAAGEMKRQEGGLRGKALCLEFTLRSSTYATMFLRELTKQTTDVEHHSQMTETLKRSAGTKREASAVVADGGDDGGRENDGDEAKQDEQEEEADVESSKRQRV